MWTPVILLLFAGAVTANQNGWHSDKEYTFKIRSRTMAALHPSEDQYTGVLMKGTLIVQPKDKDTLLAKLSKTKYAHIHTKLPGGWDSEIPDSQMRLEEFPMTGKPFEVRMKHGVVRDLVVDKDVPTWEVNVLKSIVSQLQVDTQGENRLKSRHNHGPEGEQPFAMFKTMEDSVGGKCEVLYDISPLPEKVWSGNHELVPKPELKGDKSLIEIVKTKNYTNCEQRMSYHYGMMGNNRFEPGTNHDGNFLSKSSVSRIVVSGDIRSFTIQSSETTNKVILSPGRSSKDRYGMVASRVHLSLSQVESATDRLSMPPNPQSTGNLVYSFNSPFSGPEQRRPGHSSISPNSRADRSDSSSEENRSNNSKHNRNNIRKDTHSRESSKEQKGSSDSSSLDHSLSGSDSTASREDREFWQPKPSLNEAPETPLLPFFIGNKGNSVQMSGSVDPVKKTKELANEIGHELKKPSDIPKEETLEKFTMLTRLIRTMNSRQIEEAQRDLFESSNHISSDDKSSSRRNSWTAFRDAVAEAGTGPALMAIKKMIESKKIHGMEASLIVSTASKSAMTPTPEYVKMFFKLATMPETKNQEFLRETGLLSFADLVRKSIVDKRSAHNRYPVHSFGRMFSKHNTDLFKEYIPHLIHELRSAMKEGNSPKIQTFIYALGKIAHPKVLAAFEPYLEGKEPSSKHQRILMILTMHYMAQTYPKVARSVSYKIYANTGESHEVRCAAVRVLMKTNPPASMLQRMAEMTNYDDSKHVRSAVKSSIESASKLKSYESRELANNARAARNLLSKEKFGPQYSRHIFTELLGKEMKVKMETAYIGSKDNIIPKELTLSMGHSYGGLKMSALKGSTMVSSVGDLLSYLEKKMMGNEFERNSGEERDSDSGKSRLSAEKIAEMLKIKDDGPKQIEGCLAFGSAFTSLFVPFDNHTLDHLPKMLKHASESLREGRNFNLNKFSSDERILSFPTETGFPFIYTLRMPSLLKFEGKTRLRIEHEPSDSFKLPKKVDASSDMRFLFSMKVQERVGFLTPFEHKHYIAGEDKSFQVFLPLHLEAEVNIEKKELKMKVQLLENKESHKVLQTSNVPYTSKHDILSMKPVLRDSENTRIIRKYETKKHTSDLSESIDIGTSIEIELEHEEKPGEKKNPLKKSLYSLMTPFYKSSSSFRKMSVKISPSSESSESSIKFNLSLDSKRKSHSDESDSDRNGNDRSEESSDRTRKTKVPRPSDKEPHSESRKNQFMHDAIKGIESAKSSVVDMSLEMTGRRPLHLVMTAAMARSNVDEKTRSLFYLNAQRDKQADLEVCAALETRTPIAPELDVEEIMKSELTEEFDADIYYGKDCSSGSKIRIEGKMKQTNELKKEIRESVEAKEVERQKSGDSKMMRAYEKFLKRATTLDETEMTFEFNDMASSAKEISMKLLELAAEKIHHFAEINTVNPKNSDKNKIDLKVKTTSKNGAFVTVHAPNMDVSMKNVFLEDIADSREESSESSRSSEENDLESLSELESSCLMGQSSVETFDKRVLPYELGKCWHVALTTFPKEDPDRPSHDRPIPRDMKTTILTRETEDGKKEVKIVLGKKEIHLKKPGSHMEVSIDGEKVTISKRKSVEESSKERDFEGKHKSKFEIFELVDGSVKVTSESHGVEVVFGGHRMKIMADDKYRNSVRGICGNFDGESFNDQKTPQNCQLKNPKEFAASWALTHEHCEGPAQKYAESAKRSHCSWEKSHPSNVINDEEAGRERSPSSWGYHNEDSNKSSRCTTYRTKVTRTDSHTCFSLRPVPSCSENCKPSNTKEKNVEMHCVKHSSASEKLADRIKKGANPDLSQKSVSKREKMDIPVSCQAA